MREIFKIKLNQIKIKIKETLSIEQLDYNETDINNTATEIYSVFLPRDKFPKDESNLKIRKRIRDVFSNHIGDIQQIRWKKHQYLTVFVIEFTNKDVYDKYVKETSYTQRSYI